MKLDKTRLSLSKNNMTKKIDLKNQENIVTFSYITSTQTNDFIVKQQSL